MAKGVQINDGKGGAAGFGGADHMVTPPGPTYPNPGARSQTDSDWVRKDMLYKTSLPQQKFY